MLSKSLVYCYIVSNHLSIVILCQITCLLSYYVKSLVYLALLRAMIRQGDSLHSPPRCDSSRRLAPLSSVLWLVKETRSTLSTNQRQHWALGSLLGFTLSYHGLFKVLSFLLINCCDNFGCGFTILDRKVLSFLRHWLAEFTFTRVLDFLDRLVELIKMTRFVDSEGLFKRFLVHNF